MRIANTVLLWTEAIRGAWGGGVSMKEGGANPVMGALGSVADFIFRELAVLGENIYGFTGKHLWGREGDTPRHVSKKVDEMIRAFLGDDINKWGTPMFDPTTLQPVMEDILDAEGKPTGKQKQRTT